MDTEYVTVDGSQVTLRHVNGKSDDGRPFFKYTSATVLVQGVQFTARIDKLVRDIERAEVTERLEPVPLECIYPMFPEHFTRAPDIDIAEHFVKGPSFVWEDCQPGETSVADSFLNEATLLERMSRDHHPNIVQYHGCVVKDGRITGLCLQRYPKTLGDHFAEGAHSGYVDRQIEDGITAGVHYLHSLGVAHNDIRQETVCIDDEDSAVIVDFEVCLPFGATIPKGPRDGFHDPFSSTNNDEHSLTIVDEMFDIQVEWYGDSDRLAYEEMCKSMVRTKRLTATRLE